MAGDSIVDDLGAFLKNQRHTAQMSLRDLASAAGVSNPYLSQIERGLRRPSAEVLQQIAHGLQISAAALYTRAGLLEDTSGDPDQAAGAASAATATAEGPATSLAESTATASPMATATSVVSAIQNDLHLDPAQRRALIDVYSAFVSNGRTNQE